MFFTVNKFFTLKLIDLQLITRCKKLLLKNKTLSGYCESPKHWNFFGNFVYIHINFKKNKYNTLYINYLRV